MTIIKYKTFESSKDFEEWQRAESRSIINIIPQLIEFDVDTQETKGLDGSTKTANGTGKTNFGVFVTYTETEED